MKIRILALSVAGCAVATGLAAPGPYPQRPIRMIAAPSAGGEGGGD